ncbi:MAG TPA: sigma-70 family RNA polymerase sigma factor [Baekduia sp.]|nr:sigma-70 family RNA polymerase sigma factor [Baekduia sp.]
MGPPGLTSREDTIEAHLPLVRSIAQRYVRTGEPLEDLVQAGTVGLIKAVDRFDPKRDRDLAALARPSIEGEIRHHLRDGAAGPHVPRTDRELAARLRTLATDLTASLHRPPTTAELAEAAGVDAERAERALAADGTRTVELQRDGPFAGPGDTEAAEARVLLEAGWDQLDERERRLLELRYREDRSQSEIARELGLSQAHVSRLLRATLERLRALVGEDEPTEETPRAAASAPAADGRSGRLLLRLPRTLHADVAEAAEREGVPINTYITGTLAAAVAAPDEDDDDAPPAGRSRLLILNAVLIALAALAGVALLLQAWLG